MSTKIFPNLTVNDLDKSKEFFVKLGYSINPQFTDKNAACIVISENIYVMLLTFEFMKQFSTKEIVDGKKVTEIINALSCESREEVDLIVDKALAAGATMTRPPRELDFMYTRSFDDLDGHQWEYFYMDISKAPTTPVEA